MVVLKYRERRPEIEAVQVPFNDKMIAEKDREEELRLIAQWIDSKGADVDFNRNGEIAIVTGRGFITATPGRWILWDSQAFYTMADGNFQNLYDRINDKGELVPPYRPRSEPTHG